MGLFIVTVIFLLYNLKHWYPVICHHFYESEQTGAGAYLVLRGEYFCIL